MHGTASENGDGMTGWEKPQDAVVFEGKLSEIAAWKWVFFQGVRNRCLGPGRWMLPGPFGSSASGYLY